MGIKTTIRTAASKRTLLSTLLAGFALAGLPSHAEAQEILLTGPLAGAPAVRKLKLYREGRFEVAPGATFTLLDEYKRTILLGMRLNYNFTDWLGFGVWGAYGGATQITAALSEEIQKVNADREAGSLERRLTATNLGSDFEDQLAGIDWVAAPQLTLVPFRGKIALFESIYFDTDLYVFGGAAFVGLKERGDCGGETGLDCRNPAAFELKDRVAIAPTFGFGFTFYINEWSALGLEYRGMPFAWNTGGLDTAGGGDNEEFPDQQITSADRKFIFNQLLGVTFNFYLPTQYSVGD